MGKYLQPLRKCLQGNLQQSDDSEYQQIVAAQNEKPPSEELIEDLKVVILDSGNFNMIFEGEGESTSSAECVHNLIVANMQNLQFTASKDLIKLIENIFSHENLYQRVCSFYTPIQKEIGALLLGKVIDQSSKMSDVVKALVTRDFNSKGKYLILKFFADNSFATSLIEYGHLGSILDAAVIDSLWADDNTKNLNAVLDSLKKIVPLETLLREIKNLIQKNKLIFDDSLQSFLVFVENIRAQQSTVLTGNHLLSTKTKPQFTCAHNFFGFGCFTKEDTLCELCETILKVIIGMAVKGSSFNTLFVILSNEQLLQMCNESFYNEVGESASKVLACFSTSQQKKELLYKILEQCRKYVSSAPGAIINCIEDSRKLSEQRKKLHRDNFKSNPIIEVSLSSQWKKFEPHLNTINQNSQVFQKVQHVTSLDNVVSIFAMKGEMYGAKTLIDKKIPYTPATLGSNDIANGDMNVICMTGVVAEDGVGHIDHSNLREIIMELPLGFFEGVPNSFCKISDFCYTDFAQVSFVFDQLQVVFTQPSRKVKISFCGTQEYMPLFGNDDKKSKGGVIFYDLKNANKFFASYFFQMLDRCGNRNFATEIKEYLSKKTEEVIVKILSGIGKVLAYCNEVNVHSFLQLDPNKLTLYFKLKLDDDSSKIQIPGSVVTNCWGKPREEVEREIRAVIKHAKEYKEYYGRPFGVSIQAVQDEIDRVFGGVELEPKPSCST